MLTSEATGYQVIVIGAGFAGMYALHRFRDDLGLRVRVFERGSDVGGTWYWNRYPGARCDVESMSYSYSFDDDLQQDWRWTELYPAQPEILAYANHVADRFDLRRDVSFDTSVVSAAFDDTTSTWTVTTDRGERFRAPHLVTAVGCLSASRTPPVPGIETFAGEVHHTGRWPHDGVDVSGKRVAVIGTGSSGIQVIPELAKQAARLTVLQRTPAYSIPAGNRPLTDREVAETKADYPELRAQMRVSPAGVVTKLPIGSALDTPVERARAAMDERWQAGGTGLMTTFTDTALDLQANHVLAEFVRERIGEVVDDPDTAALLTPRDYPIGAKRICLDTGYYRTFNRDNVELVGIRDTPIEAVTAEGVVVDGVLHPVDMIVFATGYDAMTGPLNAIDIRNGSGETLREKWAAGPRTYLGIATAGFPNLFMLTGPGSPSVLVNMFVSIEQHVDWVCDLVAHLRARGISRIEAEGEDEDRWVEEVNQRAAHTLFVQASSWYVGANIPGKPRVFMPYVGGMASYRDTCDQVAADGYRGFRLTGAHERPAEGAA